MALLDWGVTATELGASLATPFVILSFPWMHSCKWPTVTLLKYGTQQH